MQDQEQEVSIISVASPTYQFKPMIHHHTTTQYLFFAKMIEAIMSSTQELETGGGYMNAKEGLLIWQAAIEMGHPQGPTPLQFDNKCAHGILTGEMKQKASRTMDMRFYWLRDQGEQGQFHIHWKRGETNLGDYSSKAGHPTKASHCSQKIICSKHNYKWTKK